MHFIKVLFIGLVFVSCENKQQHENAIKLNINLNKTYQTIDGFGTCFVNYKDFPPEYLNPDFYDMVVNDLGLSILRIPIPEHTEYKNDNDDPDVFNWQGFYLQNNVHRKGLEETMSIAQEFKKRGVERFMASPWSPSQYMKTNRAPIQGGFLRYDMTKEYAEYLAAIIILAKNNYDIDVNWISLQNEAIFIQFYRSCLYNPQLMREAVRATMNKFKKEGIYTKLLLNEDMMFFDRVFDGIKATLDDPETGKFNGNIAVHRQQGKEGLIKFNELTQDYNRKFWMTETSGHDTTWNGAFKLANDIQDYLVFGNFSAWVYWQISGETGGGGNPGLYTLMLNGKPTKKYYTSKHFYRFIRPGAERIEAKCEDDSLYVSAFKHDEDKTITIQIINNSHLDQRIALRSVQNKLPRKFKKFVSTQNLNCKYEKLVKSKNSFLVPAKSIFTLYNGSDKISPDLAGKQMQSVGPEGINRTEKLGNDSPFPSVIDWQREPDGDANLLKYAQAYAAEGKIDSARFNGWTLMHDAALNGDYEALEFLIKNGANVNAVSENGWTPIHAVASAYIGNFRKKDNTPAYSKYDVFKLVLATKPNLSVADFDGITPLHAAVMNAFTAFRQLEENSIKRITDLINAGADVNAIDKNGRTPLHWACMQGYTHFTNNLMVVETDVVDILLKYGADKNILDNFDKTALDYAREMKFDNLTALLTGRNVEKGQVHNKVNKRYGKELLNAAWNGDIDEVKRLLEQGADTDFMDTDGFKAVDRARDNGYTEIVELINKHANK